MKLSVLSAALAGVLTCACAATAQTAEESVESASAIAQSPLYSNMEEVYFDHQDGKEPAPWTSLRLSEDGKTAEFLDAYGALQSEPKSWSVIGRSDETLTLQLGEKKTELRRARDVTCWAAVRKAKDKPDHSADWFFEDDLNLHDQGGRVVIGDEATGAPFTVLRIRRVTWAAGSSNRPSLALYVYKAEAPDQVISYSWTEIESDRIGISLGWMQASCTIAPRETAAAVGAG